MSYTFLKRSLTFVIFYKVVRAKERLDNEFKLAGNKQGPDNPS